MMTSHKLLLSLAILLLFACSAKADTYFVKKDNFIVNTINYFFPDDFYTQVLKMKYEKAIASGCKKATVKNPATAAVMGFLPGGGSFYTREKLLGFADLLLWPFGSSVWDSPLAWKKAKIMNMEETVELCQPEEKL